MRPALARRDLPGRRGVLRQAEERLPLRRVAITVSLDEAERARARLLELAPEGFEEIDRGDRVELAAYGDAGERLAAEFPASRAEEVEPGWEDRWREFHRPVRIGALWIGPPWEPAPAGALAVVVDPGRAFGTGAHPTTRLCLELLQELEPTSLLDVGCGSGVLAIAALALGFGPVTAVDVDPAAIEETERNAAANAAKLDARLLDATQAELPAAGVTVANISLEGVEALRPAGGLLVTSGYLVRDTPDVAGYRRLQRRELDGWAADLHEKASTRKS